MGACCPEGTTCPSCSTAASRRPSSSRGVDLGGALWTARLLGEAPERLARAHRAYVEAGARVVTTASYQASVEGLVAGGYDAAEARRLITRSVTVAQEVRDELADSHPGVLVAASVGPYGAFLADGSEYTGRYGVSPARLRDFHGPRLELLAAAGPDLLAVETIPDADEAEVLVPLLDELRRARVVQLLRARRDAPTPASRSPRRTPSWPAARSVVAAGVNCSEQTDVLGAVRAAVAATGLPAVAYPNRGGSWNADTKTWEYAGPLDLDLVDGWVAAGARFIGGCCGTGPADIALLADRLRTDRAVGLSASHVDGQPHLDDVTELDSRSGLRTASLTGTTYPPSRGHNEVVKSVVADPPADRDHPPAVGDRGRGLPELLRLVLGHVDEVVRRRAAPLEQRSCEHQLHGRQLSRRRRGRSSRSRRSRSAGSRSSRP